MGKADFTKNMKVLNVFSLTFFKENMEKEYLNSIRIKYRLDNLKINAFSLGFAFIFLMLLIITMASNNSFLTQNKLKIAKISEYGLQLNQTTNSSDYVYKDIFLINETLYNRNNSLNDSMVPIQISKNFYALKVYLFLRGNYIFISFIIFYNFTCLALSYFSSQDLVQKISYCMEIVFFNQTFHLVSGLLTVVFEQDHASMFFLIALQLLAKVFLTFYFNNSWVIFSTSSLISMTLEWTVYLQILPRQALIFFYLSVNSMVHFVCIIMSYLNMKKSKFEFFLIRNMRVEKEHIMNFIYNMEPGFITYNKSVLCINKSMAKIMANYGHNPNETLIDDRHDNENDTIYVSNNKLFSKEVEKNMKTNLFNSNLRSSGKAVIEIILRSIGNINTDLPMELYNLLNNKIESMLINNYLDLVYEKMIKYNDLDTFTNLGSVNVETEDTKYPIKKYQVSFRVIDPVLYDKTPSIELMLTDVSQIVENEKRKAVTNSRSLFLTKIAHEFKNPITSVIELSSTINEEVKENVSPDFNRISDNADYIEKVCRVMSQFLKDYTLFNNLNFPCKNCRPIKCKKCSFEYFCPICNICKFCDENQHSTFDFFQMVQKLMTFFKTLSKHERNDNPSIRFEDYIEIEGTIESSKHNVLKTNKELLYSALYNLLFYSYKSTVTNNLVVMKINRLKLLNDSIETKFEIFNQSLQIDQNFLDSLNNNKNFFYYENSTDEDDASNKDMYLKYMEVFIAYYILNKLKVNLHIDSKREGTTFSFTLSNNAKDLFLLNNFRRNSSLGSMNRRVTTAVSSNALIQNSLTLKEFKDSSPNVTVLNDRSMYIRYQSIHNFKRYDTSFTVDEEKFSKFPTDKSGTSRPFSHYSLDGTKILILDDEHLIRKTIIRHFKNIEKANTNFKFSIKEASNCFDGLHILYQHYINNVKFDLIITDESMPNMKGSSLIRLLKELIKENNFYEIPIISHTAFDTEDKKKLILDAGADYILSKPVEYEDFKDLILNILIS